jgi:MFS family permease
LNRWLVVAGAILVQLCLGAIYAWSAFTGRLTAPDGLFMFTRTQTQIVFSVGLATFAVVMALFAGRWQASAGPRVVAITGGVVMGAGYIVAGLSGTSFPGILIGIGILGGAGIGLAYVCPIATCVKWFPDRKGFITGVAVAGFGFGALIWIKLTSGFVFGPVDLTPGWHGLFGAGLSVSQVFLLYGVIFTAVITIGSSVFVNPPDGWVPDGWDRQTEEAVGEGSRIDFTVGEMVATPHYRKLFLIFMVSATSGLMVIGVIGLFGRDALTSNGIDAVRAAAITGTAMGLFYALMNGIGRIVWGTVSDRLGRKHSIALMCLLQGVMMIGFYFVGGGELGLYLGAAVIGFNFGGNFALFPTAVADYFGNRSVGTNYPWVFLAYGVGGILGPVLGGVMGDARVWMWAFVPAGIACLAAAALALSLGSPPAAERITTR